MLLFEFYFTSKLLTEEFQSFVNWISKGFALSGKKTMYSIFGEYCLSNTIAILLTVNCNSPSCNSRQQPNVNENIELSSLMVHLKLLKLNLKSRRK